MTVWVTAPWPGPPYSPHPAGSIRRDKKGKRQKNREIERQIDRETERHKRQGDRETEI